MTERGIARILQRTDHHQQPAVDFDFDT